MKIIVTTILLLISYSAHSSLNEFIYPQSELYQTGNSTSGEKVLVESAVKRIDNSMVIDSKSVVSGISHFSIYKLSENSNLVDVFSFYKSLVQSKGRTTYACGKRDCGINNYWANRVFNNTDLKGRDSSQYYVSGRIAVGNKSYFVSIYIVKNFLRKKLVRVELVPIENKDEIQGDDVLWEQGMLLNDGRIDRLTVDALKSIKGLSSVEIVAFSNNGKVISPDLSLIADKSLAELKVSLIRELVEDIKIETSIVGHRNVDEQRSSDELWFRLFAY